MTRRDEPIRPITLGNMRLNGVGGLYGPHCGHHSEVNVDAWPADVPVPSFGLRMRCSKCGNLGATTIPNWAERPEPGDQDSSVQRGVDVLQMILFWSRMLRVLTSPPILSAWCYG